MFKNGIRRIIQIFNVDLPKVGSRTISTKKGQIILQFQKEENKNEKKYKFYKKQSILIYIFNGHCRNKLLFRSYSIEFRFIGFGFFFCRTHDSILVVRR